MSLISLVTSMNVADNRVLLYRDYTNSEKILEKNISLCPTRDTNNSLYHLFAKWFADILQPVRNHINRYNSHDSFDFDIWSLESLYDEQTIQLRETNSTRMVHLSYKSFLSYRHIYHYYYYTYECIVVY